MPPPADDSAPPEDGAAAGGIFGRLLPWLTVAAAIAVIGLLIAVVSVAAGRGVFRVFVARGGGPSSPAGSAAEGPATPVARAGRPNPREAKLKWTDADGKSLILGPGQVRVAMASVGMVRGRDATGRLLETEDEFLSLDVEIENIGTPPLTYRSWFSNVPADAAVLSDNTGRVYEFYRPPGMVEIQGHAPVTEISKDESMRDRLIFVLPPSTERGDVRSLYLRLPATAIDTPGVFLFRIPVEMIDGFFQLD
jgi:hypothetical protein